jgi:hypothetical protein
VAGTASVKFIESIVQPVRSLLRWALGILASTSMENENQSTSGDTPWQSVRLGLGAVLLILCGLGLFLLDSSSHTSTARSSALMAQGR